MPSGKAPGVDGLSSDFFKHFWDILRPDLFEVFKECFKDGMLPYSCRCAVLSLLLKKGDLTFLNNWRPVALLCMDYKILSEVLSNRLMTYIVLLIGMDQSYCIPDRSIIDNLFLMRTMFDLCTLYNIDNLYNFCWKTEEGFLLCWPHSFWYWRIGFFSWVKLL